MSKTIVMFAVPGKPVQQGSKRWLPNGRMREHNDRELRPWRQTVTISARKKMRSMEDDVVFPMTGPLSLVVTFYFTRPNYHYGTGKNSGLLKKTAPALVEKMPDLDKLIRSINDSLTDAGLWKDDAQVAQITAEKRYGESAGVVISVGEADAT